MYLEITHYKLLIINWNYFNVKKVLMHLSSLEIVNRPYLLIIMIKLANGSINSIFLLSSDLVFGLGKYHASHSNLSPPTGKDSL